MSLPNYENVENLIQIDPPYFIYTIWATIINHPVASLTVPDFTILVYGSSCKHIFFGLFLALLLSLFIHPHLQNGVPINNK